MFTQSKKHFKFEVGQPVIFPHSEQLGAGIIFARLQYGGNEENRYLILNKFATVADLGNSVRESDLALSDTMPTIDRSHTSYRELASKAEWFERRVETMEMMTKEMFEAQAISI